jgi:tetratricopeptide (TPR) repeat protein
LYAHNLEGSQEVPPRRILDERSSYAATISAIAAFSDAFYNDDELSETLRGVLREQNRELLARVLPAIEPQHLPGRSMSKMEDMAHIMTLVQHFGGRREPAPAPAGDGHAEAAPAPAEIAEPPDVEPKWLDPFVFDSEPGGSERPILRPEDMVGLTGRMGGEPYKVDAIISKGTQKVVLGITHMETGHQLALAMFLSSFGPEAQLTDHLERIESNQQAYNPDEVIALCDPVLAISPTSWTAGFSKGIALSIKEDFAGALEAFDSALAGDPEDLYGLLYKAHALAQLSDHSGAVVHIARAARLHPDAFGELFGGMDSIRDTLAASIREVLRQDPERADARELMEKHLA